VKGSLGCSVQASLRDARLSRPLFRGLKPTATITLSLRDCSKSGAARRPVQRLAGRNWSTRISTPRPVSQPTPFPIASGGSPDGTGESPGICLAWSPRERWSAGLQPVVFGMDLEMSDDHQSGQAAGGWKKDGARYTTLSGQSVARRSIARQRTGYSIQDFFADRRSARRSSCSRPRFSSSSVAQPI
jgi:hypothetical protein